MPVITRVSDISSDVFAPFTSMNEPQLRHYYEPDPGLFVAETLQVAERALDAGYQPVSFLAEDRLLDDVLQLLDRFPRVPEDLPVYTAPLEMMIRLTGYNLTRGVLGLMRRRVLPSVEEICLNASRLVVLENVSNPTNVGALFRSAAALGMDGILLTFDSCDPLSRRSVRVSMGTVFQIPWTTMPQGFVDVRRFIDEKSGIYRKEDAVYGTYWPDRGIRLLHDQGFYTVSMALAEDAVPIDDPSLQGRERLAVILGNEGYGLSDRTLRLCGTKAIIPMQHGVDSLNVAAAGAVIFWQVRRIPRSGAGRKDPAV